MPADDLGYKPVTEDLVESGDYLVYECKDSNAVLDDDSGRNYFSLKCVGANEMATVEFGVNGTETVTPVNSSFAFPKCRSQCKQFYIGRKDFKPVDDTIETRAGDIAEFTCDFGHFITSTQVRRR